MPALTAEQKAERIRKAKEDLKKAQEETKKFSEELKKDVEKASKTPGAIKRAKQQKELKPIIQQFVDEEITYTELKKYCTKNNITRGVFYKVYSTILDDYDTSYHKELDYEELNEKEKKLWRESFNNDKLLKPIRKKLEKLIDELEESDDDETEEEPKKEVKKDVKKEVKNEVKKDVKKETKKPIIVKLQKLCKELNEESDEE